MKRNSRIPTRGATLSPSSSPFSKGFSALSDESFDDSPLCFDFNSVNLSSPYSQCISSVSLYSCSVPTLSVKLLDPAAQLPTCRSVSTAGYDLYSSEYSAIPAWSHKPIDTRIAITFPSRLYVHVAPVQDLLLRILMLVLVL